MCIRLSNLFRQLGACKGTMSGIVYSSVCLMLGLSQDAIRRAKPQTKILDFRVLVKLSLTLLNRQPRRNCEPRIESHLWLGYKYGERATTLEQAIFCTKSIISKLELQPFVSRLDTQSNNILQHEGLCRCYSGDILPPVCVKPSGHPRNCSHPSSGSQCQRRVRLA